ncbi:MAG: hypothetical protein JNL60_00270, partial [Bacteroidia bacterium]|nr:hypothetical protein [Bacteroidia bacterium]
IFLCLGKRLVSQSLILEGYMKDSGNKNIRAYYELRTACQLVAMGQGSKVRLKLKRREVYTLTFSKPGYQSKTIFISTYANNFYWYSFSFDVHLEPADQNRNVEPLITAGDIFYNRNLSNYDYKVYLKRRARDAEEKQATRSTYVTLKSL